jgi:dephospho-CoA kinase
MFIVGLTGGIGSGKTTITKLFAALGPSVIDADDIAHSLLQPRKAAFAPTLSLFGASFLNPKGHFKRVLLRQAIFNDPQKKKAFEAIMHPLIRQEIQKKVESETKKHPPYILLSIPLLLENNHTYPINHLLVIDAPLFIRIKRVMERDSSPYILVRAITRTQVSFQERYQQADDYLLNHHKTEEELKNRVRTLHCSYCFLGKNTIH